MTRSPESAAPSRAAIIGKVLRVASGNFLEQYDFFVYGFYATYIAKAYFPTDSETASIMLSLATFGIGFLMRPIGAIVLGAYIDRVGRRQGLLVTLGIMAIGTLTITLTPDYSRIGLLAPLIVLAGRLLQGFSAGAELGGVSVYLSEIATPGHRGFYVSFQSASQQVAVLAAALLGFALTLNMSEAEMADWGWRIPLGVGCAIIPLIFWLRGSLQETEVFEHMAHRPRSFREVSALLMANFRPILIGMMLVAFTTTSLHDHRLHPDLRQGRTEARPQRRPWGYRRSGLGQLVVAAGRRGAVRSHRPLSDAVCHADCRAADGLSAHVVAGRRPQFLPVADHRPGALDLLRDLQRFDGRVPD